MAKANGDIFLTTAQVCSRYGSVHDMTLWRWRHDSELKFPQPDTIRGRNYWRIGDLDAWDAARKKALPQSVEGKSLGT